MSIIAALFMAILSSPGQQPGNDAPAPDESVDKEGLVFLVSVFGKWDSDQLFAKIGKEYIAIELGDLSLSDTFSFDRAEGVTLYEKIEKDGESSYVPKVQVNVPVDFKKPLLMLLRQEGKIRTRIFEMDQAAYPGGSYRFVNLSTGQIRVTLNEDAYTINPGKDSLVKGGIKEEQRIKLTAAVPDEEGQGKVLLSTMAINRPNKRMIMFFIPVNENDTWTIHCRSLVDFVYPDPKE